jgi:short-subunit dehydrogenase
MIVTGASSGIGRALAERAVRLGWRVFAIGRRAERLAELARAVAAATGSIATSALDVREPGAPARIVGETLERFGRIDVVVNNAGTVAAGPISLQSDAALREQLEVHVIVPLSLLREALGELQRNGGQVVFVGSGVARVPVGGLGAYPPAKAAVRNLARVARNELRPFGIAVTYADPGAVATEFMTRAGFSGPPPWIGASPDMVARRILDAIERRKSFVNAIPWQTAFVALAELFPSLTDLVLSRTPQIIGSQIIGPPKEVTPLPPPAPTLERQAPPTPESRTPQTPHEGKARERPEFARRVDVPEISSPDTSQSPSSEASESQPASVSRPRSTAPPASASSTPASQRATSSAPTSQPGTTSRSPTKSAKADANVESGNESPTPSPVEAALEPLAERMRRSNLSVSFVSAQLVPGKELETGDVALRWAGMPNKHERALTHQVLETLAEAGFLTRVDENRYRVTRAAE